VSNPVHPNAESGGPVTTIAIEVPSFKRALFPPLVAATIRIFAAAAAEDHPFSKTPMAVGKDDGTTSITFEPKKDPEPNIAHEKVIIIGPGVGINDPGTLNVEPASSELLLP
jgi:hypothetical protein